MGHHYVHSYSTVVHLIQAIHSKRIAQRQRQGSRLGPDAGDVCGMKMPDPEQPIQR